MPGLILEGIGTWGSFGSYYTFALIPGFYIILCSTKHVAYQYPVNNPFQYIFLKSSFRMRLNPLLETYPSENPPISSWEPSELTSFLQLAPSF